MPGEFKPVVGHKVTIQNLITENDFVVFNDSVEATNRGDSVNGRAPSFPAVASSRRRA